MSTKIYNGLRFVSPDMREVYDQLHSLRAAFLTQAEAAMARVVAILTSDAIDRAALAGEACDGALFAAVQKVWDRQKRIKAEGRRDPAVDFEFNIVIVPAGDRLLGLPFCEHGAWVKALMARPFVEEYGYWNNSDGPDGLSNAEWAERGETWRVALGKSGVPSEHGLVFEFEQPKWVEADAVLREVPAKTDRALKLARAEAVNARTKETWPWGERDAKSLPPTHEIFALHRASEEWVADTPEGQALLAAKLERISAIIPEITLGVLTGDQL